MLDQYNVKLDEEKLMLITRALDIYVRLSLGQFRFVTDVATVQRQTFMLPDEQLGEFERCLVRAGSIMTGMPPYGSFGIFNQMVNHDARVAEHMRQVFRHQLWLDTPATMRSTIVTAAYPADIIKGLIIPIEKINP